MRTNGFALFMGKDSRTAAERAAKLVPRCSLELVVESARDLGLTTSTAHLVAFSLDEKSDLPVVHGFLDDGQGAEYSLIGRDSGRLFFERDALGTRGLYVDEALSCIATDHRFFSRGMASLVRAGGRYGLGEVGITGSTTPSEPRAPLTGDLDYCTEATAGLLKESVRRRVAGKRKVAVSFSGGLDSSLIAVVAASLGVSVVLCSAFAPGSRDETHAVYAAGKLGMESVCVQVDEERVRQEVRELDLPFDTTPMDKALWCIYSATARAAAESGAELLMLGQLADELFGGYLKYSKALREGGESAAAEMMARDVFASGEKAFIRDEGAVARFTEARFPFADRALVDLSLRIPVRFKLGKDGERKLVLRRAALALGLPEELASAPKKAAQYSSGVAKLVA